MAILLFFVLFSVFLVFSRCFLVCHVFSDQQALLTFMPHGFPRQDEFSTLPASMFTIFRCLAEAVDPVFVSLSVVFGGRFR